MKVLLLGDENFTFTPGFLVSHPNDEVEVACCLEEDQLREDIKPSLDLLKEKRLKIHFGVNPAQMKQKFGEEIYDTLVYILPGLAFHGCPEFIDIRSEMFKLRLHLFCFGFLKSAKPSLKTNGTIMFLWPNLSEATLPFAHIEPEKLGNFCCIKRVTMVEFDSSYYGTWKPIVHNIFKPTLPEWLLRAQFFCFYIDQAAKLEKKTRKRRLSPSRIRGSEDGSIDSTASRLQGLNSLGLNHSLSASNQSIGDVDEDGITPDDYNVLKIPPQVFEFEREQLPHVNECFHFKLLGRNSSSILVSKLTLKYDPRISGWKGDGGLSNRVGRDAVGRMLKGRLIRNARPIRTVFGGKVELPGGRQLLNPNAIAYTLAGRPLPHGAMFSTPGIGGPPPPPPGPGGYMLANGAGAVSLTPGGGQYAATALPGGLEMFGVPTAGNRPNFSVTPGNGSRLPGSTSVLPATGTAAAKRPVQDAASAKATTVKRPRGSSVSTAYTGGGVYADMSGLQLMYATPTGNVSDLAYYGVASGTDAYQYAALGGTTTGSELGYNAAAMTAAGYTDVYGNYLPAGYEMYAAQDAASYYANAGAAFPTGYEDYYAQTQAYGMAPGMGYYDASALAVGQAAGYDIGYLTTIDGKPTSTGSTAATLYSNEDYAQLYDTSRGIMTAGGSNLAQSKASTSSGTNFGNTSYTQFGRY